MSIRISETTASSPIGTIRIFTLVNSKGEQVELSTLGAGIVSVTVPDRLGNLADVALGYADPADYLHDGPCAGKIPGRYANRIAGGRFCLDGREYRLAVNNGPNALHGGPEGFQNRLWDAEPTDNGVCFSYRSKDGEEGYPGELVVSALYTWDDNSCLRLELSARTSAPTIVNLTNHTYWNLRGEDSGSVLDETLRIRAHRYIPTDDTLIPLGHPNPVEGTPMDFLTPKPLGRDIKADFPALNYAKGYDAGWLLDGWEPGRFIADAVRLVDPVSGRILTIGSDQPVAHVYTGNWLDGSPRSKNGRPYADYDGVAIEMQGVPDAPNQPQWPDQTLCPGISYRRCITFTFTTES